MIKIFFVLFEMGFLVKWNFIGEISISELFLIFSSIYYVSRTRPFHNTVLRSTSYLILALILVQIITESIIGNELNNALKGIAINIVAFLHICFLYYYLRKDRRNVVWFALGFLLRYLLLFSETDFDDLTYEDIEPDSVSLYFIKFKLVPVIDALLVILAVYFYKRSFGLFALIIGVVLVILGARSGGAIIIISGLVTFLLFKRKGVKSFLKFHIIILLIISYVFYCVYANQVLNGKIKSGNSEQLLKVENPYNPINLLMMGRTEVFVGFIAFTDRPWTGWGAKAIDPDYYYRYLMMELNSKDYKVPNKDFIIPSHSVLIGSGMKNGIFAFSCMLLIFFIVVKRSYFLLKFSNDYYYIICYYLLFFIWNMLFSPQSAFRYIIPLPIAFIYVSWELKKKELFKRKL